jgi:hypothetical protein
MQKQHREQLGFLPMMALKGKLAKGEVLIAEVPSVTEVPSSEYRVASGQIPDRAFSTQYSSLGTSASSHAHPVAAPGECG